MIRGVMGRLFGWRYLSDEQVIEIAKAHAAERGWPWHGRIWLSRGPMHTRVTTNGDFKGGNVRTSVDARTGAVRGGGYIDH